MENTFLTQEKNCTDCKKNFMSRNARLGDEYCEECVTAFKKCLDCKGPFITLESEPEVKICEDCLSYFEKCEKCSSLCDPYDDQLQVIDNSKYCESCICRNCYGALVYENEVCYNCAREIAKDDYRERSRSYYNCPDVCEFCDRYKCDCD